MAKDSHLRAYSICAVDVTIRTNCICNPITGIDASSVFFRHGNRCTQLAIGGSCGFSSRTPWNAILGSTIRPSSSIASPVPRSALPEVMTMLEVFHPPGGSFELVL